MRRGFQIHLVRPIRQLVLCPFAIFLVAMVGCSPTPPATQEQTQQAPPQQSQNQPSQNQRMPDQQAENQQGQNQDEELQMGQEVFNELKARGEIVEYSPLYEQLKPISDSITQAAQPRYNHPFRFYLVHETQPNAFATPGGYVFVVDSLLHFVKNKEELAGTLCHEVSHTIHHDAVELMEKQQKIKEREVGAAILMGPTRAHILAILLIGKLHSLRYSRDEESRADLTGSDICAQTGSNPWGLVWLFQDFKSADTNEIPQLLSDHPGHESRINALEHHFSQNPSVFGKFNRDPKSATPFAVQKDASEVFLH